VATGLSPGPETLLEGRLRWLVALVVTVFALFVLRLFQLQVLENESLARRSRTNAVRHIRIEPPRGRIEDRFGRVLATTRPAFGVAVVPHDLRETEQTFGVLARLVGAAPEDLLERLGEPRGRARFQPLTLVDDLSFEQLARVETHRFALSGVLTDVRPRRHYLEGPLAAHLLGTIGQVSSRSASPTTARATWWARPASRRSSRATCAARPAGAT
jgi:penicillin-binding protein 2